VRKDRREYVSVSIDLPMHPKLAALDDPVAGWAYVTSLCYCGQNLTDGEFPLTIVQGGGPGRRGDVAHAWAQLPGLPRAPARPRPGP
jgi:hypothetical protein